MIMKEAIKIEDLKEGMEVMLRSDLENGEVYGGVCWCKRMLKGCKVTIKNIGKLYSSFYIKDNQNIYHYTSEMIDYIIDNKKTHKMKSDKVKDEIEKLKARIAKLEKGEEFKVNQWVKKVTHGSSNIKKGDIAQIKRVLWNGFTLKGLGSLMYYPEDFTPATHEEIYNHLVQKAKEDGFDIGVEVEKTNMDRFKIEELVLITEDNSNTSIAVRDYFNENGIHLACAYRNYTTPLNECKLSKPPLKILGHKVISSGDMVGIGCHKFTKQNIQTVIELLDICEKEELHIRLHNHGTVFINNGCSITRLKKEDLKDLIK